MDIQRKAYEKLLQWKNSSERSKAILIKGARRVGKSYLAEAFAKKEYQSYGTYYDCDIEYFIGGFLPDDGDEILVSDGKYVWEDTFSHDNYGIGLENHGDIEDGMAWMSLPEPYKVK